MAKKVTVLKKKPVETSPAPTFNTTIFTTALSAAKSRLEKAMEERAEAQGKLTALDTEIPSLQRTIASLERQLNPNAADPVMDLAIQSVKRVADPSVPFAHTAPIPQGIGSIPAQVKVPAPPQPNMADEIKNDGDFS